MKGFLLLSWLTLLAAALHVTSGNAQRFATERARFLEVVPLSKLRSEVIDLLMLGHRGVYDDFGTIWILQMLVDDRIKSERPEDTRAVVQAFTRHAPRIESLYMLSCFVFALDLRRPDLCKQISMDGMRALPESWRIPVTQAFVSIHLEKNLADGATFYGLAASRPEAPEFLKKLFKNLVNNNSLSLEELKGTLREVTGARAESRFNDYLNQVVGDRERSP